MGESADSPTAADSGKENGTVLPIATPPSTEPAVQSTKIEQVGDQSTLHKRS
jgi:hypothetical protein